jgi:hypothetical protein
MANETTARVLNLRPTAEAGQRVDPLLWAIMGKLPAPDVEWPAQDRLLWFQILEMAARLVHGGPAIDIRLVEDAAP